LSGGNPNCTSTEYCAIGFSANVYVNYANNSRLDAAGFSVFGTVAGSGMDVVDRLYNGYGECADLCPASSADHANRVDPYCKGYGTQCKGVNLERLVSEGE
jgi:hypothetical protein